MKKQRRNTRKREDNTQVPIINLVRGGVHQSQIQPILQNTQQLITPRIVPTPSYVPTIQTQIQPLPQPQTQSQVGGTDKVIKIELKKRPTAKKIQLKPKKNEEQKEIQKGNKTKKARKIVVAMSSMHNRVTRANKIKDKLKRMSDSELREYLIKKKLITSDSKAPPSLLRQIAIDSNIIRSKAL
jgi:hypothetical protein